MSDKRQRFPGSVYRRGHEPDPRFSLANERTFLTWITTGLALLSAGMALHALLPSFKPQFTRPAEILLIICGLMCPLQAWFGWSRVEAALREGRPLPSPWLSVSLALALTAVGVLVLLAVVLP